MSGFHDEESKDGFEAINELDYDEVFLLNILFSSKCCQFSLFLI